MGFCQSKEELAYFPPLKRRYNFCTQFKHKLTQISSLRNYRKTVVNLSNKSRVQNIPERKKNLLIFGTWKCLFKLCIAWISSFLLPFYNHFLSVIGFIMNESLAKVQRRRPKITSKTSSLLEISRFDIISPNWTLFFDRI